MDSFDFLPPNFRHSPQTQLLYFYTFTMPLTPPPEATYDLLYKAEEAVQK